MLVLIVRAACATMTRKRLTSDYIYLTAGLVLENTTTIYVRLISDDYNPFRYA
jgi:hypothetical protein